VCECSCVRKTEKEIRKAPQGSDQDYLYADKKQGMGLNSLTSEINPQMTYEETLADVVLGEKQLEGKSVEGGVAADEQ